MAKTSGIGARCLVGGYDISGDVQAVDTIGGTQGLLDSTDITQSAHSRIAGLRDGTIGFTTFMNTANAHPVLAALPTSDTLMTFLAPALAIGGASASLVAKQVKYDPTRGNDGSLLMKTEGQGNAFGTEWGTTLTAGLRTDSAATNGTSLDGGAGFVQPAVPASTVTATNTSPLPASVVITGGTLTFVFVNGVQAGTTAGTYIVPSGQTISITYSVAPTWTWTLGSAWGAQMHLQCTAFAGTSVTVTVQQSADNSTWITLGSAFTAVSAAPAWQRVTTAAAQSFTATNASPCVFTVPGSAYANGTPVALSGTVPTGFTAGTTYYVVSSSGSTFSLSLTSGGGAVNSSSTGTGTVTPAVQRYLRAITTGTFSNAVFAVMLTRNLSATAF